MTSATIGTYVLNNLTTFASSSLGMSTSSSFLATVSRGGFGLVMALVAGALCDHFGRKPLMLLFGAATLLAVYPCFLAIVHFRSGLSLFLATAVLTVVSTLAVVPSFAAITESLPRRVRAGSFALLYALAISIFGGTTQFAITALTHVTGNLMMPAFYMIGATLLGLIAAFTLPESAPVKLGVVKA